MAWQKQTGTRHNVDCERVFNRYDMNCPRCRELASGAKPREGWHTPKYPGNGLDAYCFGGCGSGANYMTHSNCPVCHKMFYTD